MSKNKKKCIQLTGLPNKHNDKSCANSTNNSA